jgi:hypothetical protein
MKRPPAVARVSAPQAARIGFTTFNDLLPRTDAATREAAVFYRSSLIRGEDYSLSVWVPMRSTLLLVDVQLYCAPFE